MRSRRSSRRSAAAFVALDAGVAQPQQFSTFQGLAWLAVVATLGVRSVSAAAIGGMSYALLPAIFETYVPTRWSEVPAILFGLGAVSVARHPEGIIASNSRQARLLIAGMFRMSRGGQAAAVSAAAPGTSPLSIDVSGRSAGEPPPTVGTSPPPSAIIPPSERTVAP